MPPRIFLDVDPLTLRLPTFRLDGADPAKLHRQIARHGKSTVGMPPIVVNRGSDGNLQIQDGVTRATRVAKLLPGQVVTVEVLADFSGPLDSTPTIGEKLP